MRIHSLGSLAVVCGLALACSKKEAPVEASPEPPSSGAKSAPAPSAKQAEPEAPKFRKVEREFSAAKLFAVGSAAIVCEGGCEYSEKHKPKVWLLEGGKLREAPELWPGHAYERYLGALKEEDEGRAVVAYHGEYPKKLYATTDSGSRTWGGLPRVKFNIKYWAETSGGYEESGAHGLPPRRFDRALLTAPVSHHPGDIVFGADAPAMLVAPKKLHVWNEKHWSSVAAPWTDFAKATRLANGSTLVTAENGAFVIRSDKTIVPVSLDTKAKVASHVVGGSALLTAAGDKLAVFVPQSTDELRVATKEPREKPKPKPKTKPKPAAPPAPEPAADADAQATADAALAVEADAAPAEPDKTEMPAPLPFSDACKTPFVLMVTPPRPGHHYEHISKAFAGSFELQPALTFVEFVRGNITYFGAQATDEASAKRTIEVLKSRVPAIKPQLVCLDAVAQIPDPYAPPDGMRIVFLHLGSGLELRLN